MFREPSWLCITITQRFGLRNACWLQNLEAPARAKTSGLVGAASAPLHSRSASFVGSASSHGGKKKKPKNASLPSSSVNNADNSHTDGHETTRVPSGNATTAGMDVDDLDVEDDDIGSTDSDREGVPGTRCRVEVGCVARSSFRSSQAGSPRIPF